MTIDFANLLLDESPDAVIATTAEGGVLYWSKGAQSLFGYTSEEAVGQAIEEVIVPSDQIDEERGILRDALEKGLTTYESMRRRKDGSAVLTH